MSTYRISQLAERSGVPATTLRFYDTAGLLSAARTASGYRVYGEDAVERLAFISSAKLLGLALGEIRDLLRVREEGACASVRARMLPLLADRMRETTERVAELRTLSDHLAEVHAALSGPAPEGPCGPACGCTTARPTEPGPVPVELRPIASAPEPGAEAWRDAPVSCTLDGRELGERTERWRALVARARQQETIEDGLRFSFPADPVLAGRIAELAVAEQSCCAFFDFTLHLTPDGLRLDVRAPEGASGMAADLFGAPV
ncbi:MerR family transcriptional regulator [Streptomyces sp. NPDC047971]|uniref:MerR family transcriptional regulator n=1 Tax=Streptomyces sp. NPDC047971 TaxID=3154499 RepID=UPI00340A3410